MFVGQFPKSQHLWLQKRNGEVLLLGHPLTPLTWSRRHLGGWSRWPISASKIGDFTKKNLEKKSRLVVDLCWSFLHISETEILRRCSEISRTMRFRNIRWDLKKSIKLASIHHFIIFYPLPLHSQWSSFRISMINSPH